MLSNAAQKLLNQLGVYNFTPGDYYYHMLYTPLAQRRGIFASAFDELLGNYGYTRKGEVSELTLDIVIENSPNHTEFTIDITAVDASYKAKSLLSDATTDIQAGSIRVDKNGEEIIISVDNTDLYNLSLNNTPISNVAYAITDDQVVTLGQTKEITQTYVFTQLSPLSEWIVPHNLNKFPSITVVDSAGSEVVGDYTYIDSNTIRIQFSESFSGRVYCN